VALEVGVTTDPPQPASKNAAARDDDSALGIIFIKVFS
jgi:hypothetical protein